MGECISIFLTNSKHRRSEASKPAANGRYLMCKYIISLLFTFTVQKYIYPSVIRLYVTPGFAR